MAELVGRDEVESLRIELAETGRSMRSSYWQSTSSFRSNSMRDNGNEDEELLWAAIERLPTFERLRSSLFDLRGDNEEEVTGKRVVDVTKLGAIERRLFIESLFKHIVEDNRQFLQRLRERLDRVEVKLPIVEVRYKNLCVDAKCEIVHGKPLPTLLNTTKSMLSSLVKVCGLKSQEAKISIIKDVNGSIKPSR